MNGGLVSWGQRWNMPRQEAFGLQPKDDDGGCPAERQSQHASGSVLAASRAKAWIIISKTPFLRMLVPGYHP